MKEICSWMVMIVMIIFAIRYSYLIWKQVIHPTISTWFIFLAGTGLSLITYALAENYDFRSGVLNTMDVLAVSIVFLITLIYGKREVLLKPFEKYYLIVAGLIIVYGIISGDAWGSNIFTQVLITAGYFPTMQNLYQEKKNVESFFGWGCGLTAGLISLIPAVIDGNLLAVIYSLRTVFLVGIMLSVMIYYEFKQIRAALL